MPVVRLDHSQIVLGGAGRSLECPVVRRIVGMRLAEQAPASAGLVVLVLDQVPSPARPGPARARRGPRGPRGRRANATVWRGRTDIIGSCPQGARADLLS